jgi:transcription elongation GreA/GreB family factor
MLTKEKIREECFKLLDTKIQSLQNMLDEITEGMNNETKSAVGDKHETTRVMMQLEQEKLQKQMGELQNQKNMLEKLPLTQTNAKVINGSLVETTLGLIYISVGLGKMAIGNETVITISANSPLAMKLIGLKINETATMNNLTYEIKNIR